MVVKLTAKPQLLLIRPVNSSPAADTPFGVLMDAYNRLPSSTYDPQFPLSNHARLAQFVRRSIQRNPVIILPEKVVCPTSGSPVGARARQRQKSAIEPEVYASKVERVHGD